MSPASFEVTLGVLRLGYNQSLSPEETLASHVLRRDALRELLAANAAVTVTDWGGATRRPRTSTCGWCSTCWPTRR